MKSFVLFAECSIKYNGRAESTLRRGNYLIIKKIDGSIIVHGATLYKHLNYQSAGAKIDIQRNIILSTRKKERLEIKVYQVHQYFIPEDWSDNKITIRYTEAELKDYIANNLETIIGKKIKSFQQEYPTIAGPVDIVAIDIDDETHIIEVKRGKATLSACSQLERYTKSVKAQKKHPWIMSPEATAGCLDYCQEHFLRWKQVCFQRYVAPESPHAY